MAENSRKKKAFKIENRLRVALYYSFQLLVDVVILYAFIRAFSMSYNFAHDVFYDSAKNLKSKDYAVVRIEPDSSTKLVATQIYEAGLIKNKYVLMAKIKISGAGGEIKAGTYSLSQAMTYNEIIKVITNGVSLDMDIKSDSEEKKIDTPTDASMIHDNSSEGAGGGGAEGDTLPAEDGGDGNSGSSNDSGETSDNGGDAE
jgi:hypothetical protein